MSNKKNLSVVGVCSLFNITNVSKSDVSRLFEKMCWEEDNEIHVFAFVAYMKLSSLSSIPLQFIKNYPEGTVRAINSMKYYHSKFGLVDLLDLEYGHHRSPPEKEFSGIFTVFTLCFINHWTATVNPDFKIDNNLVVHDKFQFTPGYYQNNCLPI